MSIADSISVGGALTAEGAAEDGVEDGSEDNPEHNLEHNKKSSAAGTQLWRGTGFYSNVAAPGMPSLKRLTAASSSAASQRKLRITRDPDRVYRRPSSPDQREARDGDEGDE
jgi:hypothetical protein